MYTLPVNPPPPNTGLRTVIKPDIGSSAADLVYGTTLRLPGNLVEDQKRDDEKPSVDFVRELVSHMQTIRPTVTADERKP